MDIKNQPLELPSFKSFVLASKLAIVFAVLAGLLDVFYDKTPVLKGALNLINTALFLYLIYGIKRCCVYKKRDKGVPFNLFIVFYLLLLVVRTSFFFVNYDVSTSEFRRVIEEGNLVVITLIIFALLVGVTSLILWFKLAFRLKAIMPEYGLGTLFITYALTPIVLAIAFAYTRQHWILELIWIVEVFLLVEIKSLFENQRDRRSSMLEDKI